MTGLREIPLDLGTEGLVPGARSLSVPGFLLNNMGGCHNYGPFLDPYYGLGFRVLAEQPQRVNVPNN